MSRDFKFRVWDGENIVSLSKALLRGLIVIQCDRADSYSIDTDYDNIKLMQFTGLKDKNDKEIYELMELDGKYRVIWNDCSFVLQDISNGDIVGLLNNSLRRTNERDITREYSPMEEN